MLFWWSLTIGYHLKVCLFVFNIRISLFTGLGILSIQIIGLLTAKKNNTNNWTFVLIPDILMIRLSYSCVHFTKCSTIATRQIGGQKMSFVRYKILDHKSTNYFPLQLNISYIIINIILTTLFSPFGIMGHQEFGLFVENVKQYMLLEACSS